MLFVSLNGAVWWEVLTGIFLRQLISISSAGRALNCAKIDIYLINLLVRFIGLCLFLVNLYDSFFYILNVSSLVGDFLNALGDL